MCISFILDKSCKLVFTIFVFFVSAACSSEGMSDRTLFSSYDSIGVKYSKKYLSDEIISEQEEPEVQSSVAANVKGSQEGSTGSEEAKLR